MSIESANWKHDILAKTVYENGYLTRLENASLAEQQLDVFQLRVLGWTATGMPYIWLILPYLQTYLLELLKESAHT